MQWPAVVAPTQTAGHRESCIRRHARRHIYPIHSPHSISSGETLMKKILVLAALACATLLATRGTALAQPYSCVIVNGQKCYVVLNDDGTLDTTGDNGSMGQGDFKSTTSEIPSKGDVNTMLDPSAITATVGDPTYGEITTTLGPSRQSSPATISTIKPGSRFPLQVSINFYAEARLTSVEKVYERATELKFSSNNVNSVNPFKNETLTLQNDADFYQQGDESHTTVFTLQAGSTSVTLGSSDNGDRGDVR
jgi:hypothetical protein